MEQKSKKALPYLEILKYFNYWMSNRIKYSISGYYFNIKRPNLGSYAIDDASFANCRSIMSYLLQDSLIHEGCRLMFKSQAGDCGPQSMFLSIALKRNALINNEYRMYFSEFDFGESNHAFLALIPRSSNTLAHIKDSQKASLFLGDMFSRDVIMLDPWLNEIFLSPSMNCNPISSIIDQVPGLDIENLGQIKVELINLNINFRDVEPAGNFKGVYKEILDSELRKLINGVKVLEKDFEDKDFNLMLRRSCVSSENIEITKFLIHTHEHFGVNVFAKGAASGSALDIARGKGNTPAVKLLEYYEDILSQQGKARA